MANRKCPVCGGTRREPFLTKPGLDLVRCADCSMVYANPVPETMVSGEFYHGAAVGYYLSADKLEADYSQVRFERELRLFRRYCTSGAVLDVGCSTGGFLYQLAARFKGQYATLGSDVSGPALDYAAARGIPVVRGSFLDPKQITGAFQAVTFWAVLEHLDEPRLFLNRAATLLVPGGRCFVLVPNFKSLAVRLLGLKYRYIYPQHLNYFRYGDLARLVEPQFRVLESCYTHFNPVVIWQDWRSRGSTVSNESRGALLARTNALKTNKALRPLHWAYRSMEWCLGVSGLADNLALVLEKRA